MDNTLLYGRSQPLEGRTFVWTKPWDGWALEPRDIFEARLREVGLPDDAVSDALRMRDKVELVGNQLVDYDRRDRNVFRIEESPVRLRLLAERHSAIERLRGWFVGRVFRVDDSAEIEFDVPLFVLAAADVAGCTASFETNLMRVGGMSWAVTLVGSGLSGAGGISVSTSSKFTAAHGEIKVVFLPVSVTVEKVTVLEHGHAVGEGHRIDLSKLRTTGAPSLRILPSKTEPRRTGIAERYLLSGDSTGAAATYQYAYMSSATLDPQIGANAFGFRFSLKVNVRTAHFAYTYI